MLSNEIDIEVFSLSILSIPAFVLDTDSSIFVFDISSASISTRPKNTLGLSAKFSQATSGFILSRENALGGHQPSQL